MRFMVFMIPDVYQPKSGRKPIADHIPDAAMMEKMGRFNQELEAAGAVLAVDGLHPLAKGARLTYSRGKATVTDGPRAEAKEVVGGYWLLEAPSKEQVVEWMKRCPAQDGDTIEIRQVFEIADLPEEARAVVERRKK